MSKFRRGKRIKEEKYTKNVLLATRRTNWNKIRTNNFEQG